MQTSNNQFHPRYYYSPNPQRRPQLQPKPPRRRPKVMATAVLTGILVLSVAIIHAKLTHEADAIPPSKATASSHSVPQPPTTSDTQMASSINQIITANSDVDISVSITDLTNNKTYHFGLQTQFDEASVGKLLTAIDWLHHVQQGDLSLDQSVGNSTAQQNLEAMIEQSDNDAWQNLNTILTHPDLMNYAHSIGITGYNADNNTIDSDSIALLEAKLYKGQLLNQTNTQLLLNYMKNANRTDFILAALPSGVTAYHKAGWLDDRDHDAAIIDNGHHPYVLVIFTNGHDNYHPEDRTTLIHQITKATVDHFISKT